MKDVIYPLKSIVFEFEYCTDLGFRVFIFQ